MDHKILLGKLYRYGIRGQPLNLLASYLENRKQYVCVGNSESQHLACNIGVPQGSVLGPLLYIIYANDLNYLIATLIMIMFADDTAVVIKSSSKDILMTYVNYVLDKIQDWCNFNKLSLNKTKTKIMYITNKIVDFPKIYLNDAEIEAVKSFKYLGFIIDNKLSHKYQIQSVISKLRRYRYITYKVKDSITLGFVKNLYYGLIYSILCYGTLISAGTIDTVGFSKIQSLQDSIVFNLFSISGNSKQEINKVYYRNKLLKICDLYKLKCSTMMYDVLQTNSLPFLRDKFYDLVSSHRYSARNDNNFKLPFPSSRAVKLNYIYKAISIWNELDGDLRNATSPKELHARLKNQLIAQYS